jgi:predicted O-methyltransferase YrrM
MTTVLRDLVRRRAAGPADAPAAPSQPSRSAAFRGADHPRFWWHQLHATDYVPPIYATLSDREWQVMAEWYDETARRDAIGEINVPAMGLLQGLVMGNGLRRIVQLGHFYGYSALLLGFWLRQMGGERKLFSIDIDPAATEFCEQWVARAGLGEQVGFHVGDSADPVALDAALAAMGGPPELVIIDSSHQYGHTLRELDLWVDQLPPAAIMLLHDVSVYAQTFDSTGEGGVRRALGEWVQGRDDVALLTLNGQLPQHIDPNETVYKDGCGMGILQRLAPAA